MKKLMFVSVLTVISITSNLSASWVTAPMTNPGAETGDMTGWITSPNIFTVVNDSAVAYEGDHYFFSRPSRTQYNGVSFNQDVYLSSYTGSILNVDVTVAYQYQTGQRWGYDADTDTSYLYDWKGSFAINAYSADGFLFGIGLYLNSYDYWNTDTISLSWRSDWETKRDSLDRINVRGTIMYSPATSGDPASYNVETWESWVGDEPTFVGFDAFNVSVEIPMLLGDYNSDNIVDQADYTIWADSYGNTGTGLPADGNNDDIIDQADYTIWADNYGSTLSSPPTTPIPEPTTLTLLTLTTLTTLIRRRWVPLFDRNVVTASSV